MKKVLLDGFYGHNNLGDDYILYSIVDSISETECSNIIIICDENYTGYEWLYEKYPAISFTQTKMQHTKDFFENLDGWIIGGGGLFPQEHTKWLLKKLMLIKFAQRFGVKIIIHGVEINPVKRKINLLLWDYIRKSCDFVSLRNSDSKKNFKKLVNVQSYSDVTFALETDAEQKNDFFTLHDELSKLYNVWALAMPWSTEELEQEHYKKRYCKLIMQIVSTINKSEIMPVFVPFYDENDNKLIKDIVKKLNRNYVICDQNYLVEEKRQVFLHAKKCFCMRYHSVLFALYNSKNFIAISYSPKTSELLKEYGLYDYCIEFGIRSTNFFYKEFDMEDEEFYALTEKNISQEKLLEISDMLKKKAQFGKKQLKDWIDEKNEKSSLFC